MKKEETHEGRAIKKQGILKEEGAIGNAENVEKWNQEQKEGRAVERS